MPAAPARTSLRVVQRETTRHNLLVAARAAFRAEGVDAVSMEDIARAAEVGRATIYLHFTGKQALLVALLAEDWDSQMRLFRKFGEKDDIGRAAIAAWLGRVIDGMRGARSSFGIHRVAMGQDAAVAELHRAHRRMLAAILIDRAARRGGDTGRHVEAAMIVAEIEYLAAAAVTEWNAEETATGVTLMTDRIAAFLAPQDLGGQGSS